MRWTSSFIPTLKEDPQEAEAVSRIGNENKEQVGRLQTSVADLVGE